MKKTTAQTTLEINTDCPHCGEFIDITDQAKDQLDDDLRAHDIDCEITCPDCGKTFEVTEIYY
jgi:endogenous inhibitor of DNA gyrase (YacG/DUF329 family)